MASTSFKPFAAGLAATLSLVGGAIVAGHVASDMFGSSPAFDASAQGPGADLVIARPRPGIDQPTILNAIRQPDSGVAVSVSARPVRQRTTSAGPGAAASGTRTGANGSAAPPATRRPQPTTTSPPTPSGNQGNPGATRRPARPSTTTPTRRRRPTTPRQSTPTPSPSPSPSLSPTPGGTPVGTTTGTSNSGGSSNGTGSVGRIARMSLKVASASLVNTNAGPTMAL